jgi:3-methyladenine DNA glycosylase Mpg
MARAGPAGLCIYGTTLINLEPGNHQLWIKIDPAVKKRGLVTQGKRIGVAYAGLWQDKLWRFTLKLSILERVYTQEG